MWNGWYLPKLKILILQHVIKPCMVVQWGFQSLVGRLGPGAPMAVAHITSKPWTRYGDTYDMMCLGRWMNGTLWWVRHHDSYEIAIACSSQNLSRCNFGRMEQYLNRRAQWLICQDPFQFRWVVCEECHSSQRPHHRSICVKNNRGHTGKGETGSTSWLVNVCECDA